jgi:hypothetical protein
MGWPKWLPNLNPPLKARARFFLANWKLGVHLIFRTKHFGVNNKWWFPYVSLMGWPTWKIIWGVLTIKPVIDNLKGVHRRASTVHLLDCKSFRLMYGREKELE